MVSARPKRCAPAIAAFVVALVLVTGCAPLQPQRQYAWVPSPNFDQRRPNFIIVHHTQSDTVEHALATLTSPAREVSSHYLIGRDGRVLQLVDDLARAWHAGRSWWGGHTDLNSVSIGIELDNNGSEPFAEPQMAALEKLLRELVERFRIPRENIIGHGDIAPGRKVDPSRYFPWQRLAQAGFGLWCVDGSSTAAQVAPATRGTPNGRVAPVTPGTPAGPIALATPATPIDPVIAMMAIGYDVSRPDVARQAFRRHFLGIDDEGDWTERDRAMLACLVRTQVERNGARGL
jgi:N-acetylmuramoyl-L-alanine amidase